VKKSQKSRFPKRVVILVTGLISLALGASGFHTFMTLKELRSQMLENQARELATSLNRRVQGPQKWSDSRLWESTFKQEFEAGQGEIAFLGLFDSSGQQIVQVGQAEFFSESNINNLKVNSGSDVYWFEHEMPKRRGGPPWETNAALRPATLMVGLNTVSANLLMIHAYRHLTLVGLTIIVLWLMAYFLLRSVRSVIDFQMKEASEKHLADLGRMSASLAHEIRNPLGAMKGLSQVALEDLPARHQVEPMLRTVISEAERLETLVNDLLTFARPKSPQIEKFDLAILTSEVIELIKPEADQHGISIELTGMVSAEVHSDRDGLRQVILNVLKNALEANPEEGKIIIEIKTGSDGVILSVCDEGPGIGDTGSSDLFEPFQTSKPQGSGLGLAICRQIMEKLGGEISLENGKIKGACSLIQIRNSS